MAGGAVRRGPYRVAVEVCRWTIDEWAWIDGQSILRGVDLTELLAEQLIHAMLAMILERSLQSSQYSEVKTDLADKLTQIAYPRPVIQVPPQIRLPPNPALYDEDGADLPVPHLRERPLKVNDG